MRAVVLDDNPVVLAKLPVFGAPVAFVEFGGYLFGLGALVPFGGALAVGHDPLGVADMVVALKLPVVYEVRHGDRSTDYRWPAPTPLRDSQRALERN
jgi:hypothetical protein